MSDLNAIVQRLHLDRSEFIPTPPDTHNRCCLCQVRHDDSVKPVYFAVRTYSKSWGVWGKERYLCLRCSKAIAHNIPLCDSLDLRVEIACLKGLEKFAFSVFTAEYLTISELQARLRDRFDIERTTETLSRTCDRLVEKGLLARHQAQPRRMRHFSLSLALLKDQEVAA